MKTKDQKKKIIEETQDLLKSSKNVIFVDFTGISDEDIKELRRILRAGESKMRVIKKRLLRVALEKSSIDFNPEKFDAQVATIFSPGLISDVASPIYKFFKDKEKKGFNILGSFDLSGHNFMDSDSLKRIGQLPSREILLAQFAGMLSMPMKMFLNVLDQKAKMVESK